MSLLKLLTPEGMSATDNETLATNVWQGRYSDEETGSHLMKFDNVNGRFSRPCFHFPTTSAYMGVPVSGAPSEVIVEFAFKLIRNGANGNWASIVTIDGPSDDQVGVYWDYRSGTLAVLRGTSYVGTSSNSVVPNAGIQFNVWHHLSVRVLVDNSAGEVEIHLDGVNIFDLSSLDTQQSSSATVHRITFGDDPFNTSYAGPSNEWYLQDVVIKDDAGTKLNAIEGDRAIYVLDPTGDTADEDWATSAGSDSYAVVDETPVDGDTDYLESATATDVTILSFENLPGTVASVDAVQLSVVARKTDAFAQNLQIVGQHSASQNNSADLGVPGSFVWLEHPMEDVPGGSDWTTTQVNALEGGVELP